MADITLSGTSVQSLDTGRTRVTFDNTAYVDVPDDQIVERPEPNVIVAHGEAEVYAQRYWQDYTQGTLTKTFSGRLDVLVGPGFRAAPTKITIVPPC